MFEALGLVTAPAEASRTGPAGAHGDPRGPWSEHIAELDGSWDQGEHASLVAPTGEGKTHLLRHLLENLWTEARVLVLDVTGDDAAWKRDFITVHQFPPSWWERTLHRKDRQWFRLILTRQPL